MKGALLFLIQVTFGCQLQAQLKAVQLLTDNFTNPIGLGNASPRFSWLVSSTQNNTLQTAYEIRVSEQVAASSNNKLLWNSGKVLSDQSVFVAYGGPAVAAGKKCNWQVRIWDNHNKRTSWSNVASFQTGLLHPNDWKAKWIEAKQHEEGALRPAHVFSKQFSVVKKVQSATAYITAHGVYEVFLNGKRVGDAFLAPGWTAYQKRLQYQAYDVTGAFQNGENSVEVTVGSGWYRTSLSWSPEQHIIKPKLGLLFQLQVQYADGSEETIVSDNSWKVTAGGPVRNSEIYDGEIYDARLDRAGQLADKGGATVVTYSLDNLVATGNELVKKHEVLPALKLIRTPKGETVLDFGQNMVGWVNMRMKGKSGDSVRIYHAEALDREGNFYTENLRGAKQQNLFILNGELRLYEPHFTFQGFRYIKIEGSSEAIDPKNFSAVALYSDMPPAGSFSCSNSLVNRLQKNIEWGQKGNFIDIPSDCPQRDERLGWTGDAQVFTRTAAFNRNVYNFFSKWLKDLAAEQLPGGMVPAVVPNVFGAFQGGSSGWGDAATIIPWELYNVYGDTAILRNQYASMKAWVNFIEKSSSNDLWRSGFQLGDWLYFRSADDMNGETANTNKFYIAQCFWAHSTQLMINTAALLGKAEDVVYYRDRLQKIKAAFLKEYITPNGQFVSGTQTAYLLALEFEMLPENMQQSTAEKLVNDIIAHNYHLSTGFLGTPYICHVLSRYGHNSVAFRLLLQETYPSWLYPVTMGATTIWERWDGIKPDGTFQGFMMNSLNHYSYGAVGDWMYRVVAGIEPLEPGFKKIRLAPQPDSGLQFAKATYQSVYGKIVSGWERKNGTITVNVEVPANTTAQIHLQGNQVQQKDFATGKNSKLSLFANPGSNTTDIEVGSGYYAFTYPEVRQH